jgi:ABC-2 type transport system ATP-binding protein
MALIEVADLTKTSILSLHGRGLLGAVKGLFSPRRSIMTAVDHLTFSIGAGESVGYVGPNGAGTSATVKILSGILMPTSGQVRVAERVPHRNRMAHAMDIGVVFGQCTQLWWDIPVVKSLNLLRAIYEVPDRVFHTNLALFSDVLGLNELLDKPVRTLSLWQRTRCDLAAALLHDPAVVFLDEPTIGLDILARDRIHTFLRTIRDERGTAIILTTHDMRDIEAICERIMIIDRGQMIYDGSREDIQCRFGRHRVMVLEVSSGAEWSGSMPLRSASWEPWSRG